MCDQGHASTRWWSQPEFPHGVPLGDVMMGASILFSGNNYDKTELLCRFMNMSCIDSTKQSGIQRNLLIPVVEEYWDLVVEDILSKYKDPEVTVVACGDGRNDR